jgi:UDP-N-acetyl-D-mannosaminuronic acid dehydrogenase
MVKEAVLNGKLTAKTKPVEADVFIIAVPTPVKDDKKVELSYVESATQSIIPHIKKDNIVILESTSPPGTTDNIVVPILEKSALKAGRDFMVAHSPERVLPGRIMQELVENSRIIGGIDDKSSQAVRKVYKTFVEGEIFLTDAKTAEVCKLMENTYRDVNIALSNELAKICENIGVNVWDVIELSNKHPRVNLHMPGPGVGGHCIAVDPWFLIENQEETARVLKLCRDINDSMPLYVYEKIKNILAGSNDKKTICILGITYKPDVDDIRESPILKLMEIINEENKLDYRIVDPHVKNINNLYEDLYEAIDGSDLLLMAVNHSAFKNIEFKKVMELMKEPNILDTRNFWGDSGLSEKGFSYYLLGNGR